MIDEKDNFDPKPNPYSEVVEKLTTKIFDHQSFAKLSEGDLRVKGLIGQTETMGEFVRRQMRFDHSLQAEAFELFCATVPPPVDTKEVYQWREKKFFPRDLEDQIRLRSFEDDNDEEMNPQIQPPYEELRDFIRQIIANASVIEIDGESTVDPTFLRGDMDELLISFDSYPEVKVLNGQSRWCIRIPRYLNDTTADDDSVIILPPPFCASDYLVVADSDKASKLTTAVFSEPELLSFMLKKLIPDIQEMAKTKTEVDLYKIAFEKYQNASDEVEKLNNTVKTAFFDKLLNDAGTTDIELIKIVRDRKDVETLRGEASYDPDRVGSESGETRFSVTKGKAGELVFRWEGIDTVVERDTVDGVMQIKMVKTPKEFCAMVRNHNGILEFADGVDSEDEITWLEVPGSDSYGAKILHNLFLTIRVITVNQWLEDGERARTGYEEIIKVLSFCSNSIEYANKFRELGIAGYPTNELIVNPGKKVNFVIDSISPPPLVNSTDN